MDAFLGASALTVLQTSEQISFNEVVKQNVDKEMKLVVYNSKTDRTRGIFL